jgi:hypothetical protein
MHQERMQIARAVADHLLATEEAIDQAIAAAAGLVGFMPIARRDARLSTSVGQPAIEQVIASLETLSIARRQMIEAHRALSESAAQARVPATNFGGFVDKSAASARLNLEVVSERKAG